MQPDYGKCSHQRRSIGNIMLPKARWCDLDVEENRLVF